MIRIFTVRFPKLIQFPNYEYKTARKIYTSIGTSVQQKKPTLEEITERKRKDERDKEMRWTKFYQFTDMKYHSIVTRLKIYSFLSTVVLTPVAYIVEIAHLIPEFTFVPCLAFGEFKALILEIYFFVD